MPSPNLCKICGNTGNHNSYTAREMMYGLRHEFIYFQCIECKCLQIAQFPGNIHEYYQDNYYSYQTYDGKKFKGIKGYFKRKQYYSAIFHKGIIGSILNLLFPIKDYRILNDLNINKNTRILDVGSGNGKSFLYPLKICGLNNVLGCDPYLNSTIEYPNGLMIKNCSVFDIDENFDIITYHHSFEHISDPIESMKKVWEILPHGGTCVIRIPTCSSYAWEHYKTNWAQLDAPRHFFLHSVESMKYMADKIGFELYKIEYDSTHFQFSGSEKYVNDTPLRKPRKKGIHHFIKRKLKKFKYIRMAKKLNREKRGDQAAFFLRKPANPNQ